MLLQYTSTLIQCMTYPAPTQVWWSFSQVYTDGRAKPVTIPAMCAAFLSKQHQTRIAFAETDR